MKTLIQENYAKTIAVTDFKSVIETSFQNKFEGTKIPTNLKDFDLLVEEKKSHLLEILHINLTSKKQRVARNLVAKFLWNAKNGYSSIQGTWRNLIDEKIEYIKQSKNMPESMILVKDTNDDILYKLRESSNIDVQIEKRNFKNIQNLQVDEIFINDDLFQKHYEEMTSEYEAIMNSTYFLSEMAVDIGYISYGQNQGFGSKFEDFKYIKETFGISVLNHGTTYHAVNDSEQPIVILKLVRSPNKDIQNLIQKLEEMKELF